MFIVPLSSMPALNNIERIDKQPIAGENQGTFGDVLRQKIQDVKDLEMQSLQSAYEISTGMSNDIESAMIDSAKASTAIQMTTQLTTRAVNIYKEIMQMQI